jgi:hypothetical protein
MELIHAQTTLLELTNSLRDKSFRSLSLTERVARLHWSCFDHATGQLMSVLGYALVYGSRVAIEWSSPDALYWDVFTDVVYKGLTVRFMCYGSAKTVRLFELPGVDTKSGQLHRRVYVDAQVFAEAVGAAAAVNA